jgi:aryl sulfotransferase
MKASRFEPHSLPDFSAWKRYLSYVPLYGIGVPLATILGLAGKWPHAMARRAWRSMGGFGDYRATANDLFVCSYIKSGTTWMLQLAIQVAHRGEAEFDNILYAIPWPDGITRQQPYMIPLEDPSPVECSPTGLRVIKTHLPFSSVPRNPDSRYIVVVRDPKDVCVSAYFFFRANVWGPLAPTVANWIDFYTSDAFVFGDWATHLASYWAQREAPNILFLTFEEIKQDLDDIVRRVADFAGVRLNDEQFARVCRRTGFDYMKRNQSRFDPVQTVPWAVRGGSMVRSGRRGGSAELLSKAQRRQIDARFRAALERLDCDFPYDKVFAAENSTP